MQVSLIRPPVYFSASSYSTPLALPIGPAYLAAVLERAGIKVELIDALGLGIQKIQTTEDPRFKFQGLNTEEILQKISPDSKVIGISLMFSQEWPFIRPLIARVREKFPGATIVLGGEHASALSEYCLRDCRAVDYVVRGEGEAVLLDLVKRLLEKNDPELTPGVDYLREGEHVSNLKSQARITEVNSIPWPAWHLIDLEPYFQSNFTMGISHGRNMAMLATRGCPFRCTFCSSPTMWTTRYTMRDVSDVVDEMQYYQQRYHINSIDFYDLTAIVKKQWILDFIHEVQRRKIHLAWQLPSGTRSEALDTEVLEGLSKSNLKFLVYAPESGSPVTLKEIKKQVNLTKMTASIRTAKAKGLTVKANFVIGFPVETRLQALQTILYCWKLALLGVDDCNVCLFSPYPGSQLYNELKASKKINELNDEYFKNLMTQFDFLKSTHFSQKISGFELLTLRLLGIGGFYLLSYIVAPYRWVRLMRQWISKTPFRAGSLFEQRVHDFLKRRQAVERALS